MAEQTEDDGAYYQRRAEEELAQAQRSSIPEVVAAHYKLAELYLERLSQLSGGDPDVSPQES